MKNLKDILEKLIINKNTGKKYLPKKDFSQIEIKWSTSAHFNVYCTAEHKRYFQQFKDLYDKHTKPSSIANRTKDFSKLINRFYYAILLKWNDCIKTLKQEITNRGIIPDAENQIDAYLYNEYNRKSYYFVGGWSKLTDKEISQSLENYFKIYNI